MPTAKPTHTNTCRYINAYKKKDIAYNSMIIYVQVRPAIFHFSNMTKCYLSKSSWKTLLLSYNFLH